MKKVLIIGGSGFLGRHMLGELSPEQYRVYAIGHRKPVPPSPHTEIIRGGIGAIDGRLLSEIKPDVVLHLARPAFPGLRKTGRLIAARYAEFLNRRLIRTLAFAEDPVRMVFASGSLMYGPSGTPSDEDSPLHPASYARQYFRGELPVLQALQKGQPPLRIIRFPWLLGKGSWFEWFYLQTMKQSHAVPLFGKGDNRMEVLDVRDAVKIALRHAMENEGPGIMNLVPARSLTQMEFATAVSKASGFPVKDYREVFPGRPEKEALEAFTSNVVLATKFPHRVNHRDYTPLEESLSRIFREYGCF